MTNNYFAVGGRHYFFVDYVPESIESAFELATLTGEKVAIFRPCPIPGAWDRVPVIGHRSRVEILQEMQITTDTEELTLLGQELHQFDSLFFNVGRKTVPLQVAA